MTEPTDAALQAILDAANNPDPTASEFLEIVEWTWCQTQTAFILHACRQFDGDDDLVPVGGQGVTVCGIHGRLSIPGMFSRMSAPRCRKCCRALGWPEGIGSPKNSDEALRGLAKARMEMWRVSHQMARQTNRRPTIPL